MFGDIEFVNLNEFTITSMPMRKGSNMKTWNIDLNGKPFGQIWTFKAKGEYHPYHVKAKYSDDTYAKFNTYREAELHIRALPDTDPLAAGRF